MSESQEKLIESTLDFDGMLEMLRTVIHTIGELFGLAFTKMISKYSLEFQAEKVGEEPPEGLEDIDSMVEYIKKHKDKYSGGYNSLLYGIAKAEKMFEGALGSGAKSVAYNVILKVISDSGVLDSFEGKMEDLYEALSNYLEMSAAINLAVSQKIRKDSESAVLVNIISCPFKDTCEVANREGITRVTGGQDCIVLISNTAALSKITGKALDYTLEKYDPPNCEGKIYEI